VHRDIDRPRRERPLQLAREEIGIRERIDRRGAVAVDVRSDV